MLLHFQLPLERCFFQFQLPKIIYLILLLVFPSLDPKRIYLILILPLFPLNPVLDLMMEVHVDGVNVFSVDIVSGPPSHQE